jgi:hypothetical protein
MENKNQKYFLLDEKDRDKLEKLAETARTFNFSNLTLIENDIFKGINVDDKKKILITLLATYLSLDFVKWIPIKDKIEYFNKKLSPGGTKKGLFDFFKIFKKEKSSVNVAKKESSAENSFCELYINIGKDKKIYPRDLIHFICTSMKIDAKDIKNIRIFEKFSFFQIPQPLCEKAIVLLSVKKVRGKNIKVNYSKHDGAA